MYLSLKSAKSFKIVLVLLLLNSNNVFSQLRFFSEEIRYSLHAKTSVLFSNITGEYSKKELKPNIKTGPSIGCFMSIALNDQLAVEPGVSLSLKGSRTKLDNTTVISNDDVKILLTERGFDKRDLYYIDFPLMVSYRLESRLTMGIGMSGSLLVKARHDIEYTSTQVVNNKVTMDEVSKKTSNTGEYSTFDAGILFSIGYMIKDGLEASANYYGGLADIKDPDRKFKNACLGISLSYRFMHLKF